MHAGHYNNIPFLDLFSKLLPHVYEQSIRIYYDIIGIRFSFYISQIENDCRIRGGDPTIHL